jgi:hypothetical protein
MTHLQKIGAAGTLALAIVCLTTEFGTPCAFAEIPATELTSLSRVVGQAASAFPVSVTSGANLEEIDQLVFSHSGIKATLQTKSPRLLETDPQPNFSNFDVTVGPDVPPGLYEVRAKGRLGLSNPRAFLVTSTPVQFVEQEHSSLDSAIDLSQQQIVAERALPQRRNYYRIELALGDTVNVVAHARKLDSRALISLILIDPAGKEVARARSFDNLPSSLKHTTTKPGLYTLLAYDFLYQGGNEHYYALQATVTPSGTTTTNTGELDQLCADAAKAQTIARASLPGARPFSQDPAAATAVWLAASHFAPAESRVYTAPFSISGDFANSTRTVNHEFTATAGQNLWIEVCSAKLDQLTDPRLIVYKVTRDGEGKETLQQLLEQDDAATIGGPALKMRLRDPYVQFSVSENANYRIQLIDNASGNRAPESLRYVLNVREAHPTFDLLAYAPFPINTPATARQVGSHLMRGGTEAIHVLALRKDGFAAPIELSVDGLPAGVTCHKAIVGTAASSAMLILQASDDAAAWTGSIRVVGRSMESKTLERPAMAACVVRGATPTHNSIESRLAGDLCLNIDALDTAPFLVTIGDGQAIEMSRGSKLPLPIKAIRRAGGASKFILRPQDLPPKVSLAETPIEPDKSEAAPELTVAPDAPVGEYTFWMQNETKVKWRLNPQSLDACQAYMTKLKQAIEDPNQADRKAEFEAAMKTANEEIEKLKQATAEKEYTVFMPTTLARIRILETPFRVMPVAKVTAAPGADVMVDIAIERLFGFADPIDISLQGNAPVEGLQVANLQIPSGMAAGKLSLKIPASANATSLTIPIKMDCKFNGHALSRTANIELTITPPQ